MTRKAKKYNMLVSLILATVLALAIVMPTGISDDNKIDNRISSDDCNDTEIGHFTGIDPKTAEGMLPNTIYVDDDNTEGPWDGTQEYPYQYIQDGVNAANPGDTVFMFSGNYPERVTIDKTIDLIGEDRDTTVLDDSNSGIIIEEDTDYVTVSGFTIINSMPDSVALVISRYSEYTTVSDNNIYSYNEGIYVSGWYNDITDNIIQGEQPDIWSTGINFDIADDNNIFNNTIDSYDVGIYLDGYYNTVAGNIITNNTRWGILVDGYCMGSCVYNNYFADNYGNAYAECDDCCSWYKSYPICGNYWDTYSGDDNFHGSGQDIPGSDGIGDRGYCLAYEGVDKYPLMIYHRIPGDINGDGVVNTADLLVLLGEWGWPCSCADVNYDGIVNVEDLLILLGNWTG